MIRMRSLWPLGMLTGVAAWVGVNLAAKTPEAAAVGPIAQIIAPANGFKLRQGYTTAVRVRVQPGDHPLQGWTLRLRVLDGSENQLAAGTRPVLDAEAAQLAADKLTAGETYTLLLDATDTARATAAATVSFLIPDPQYTLVPLEPGNFSEAPYEGFSVDGSGSVVSFGGKNVNGRNFDVLVLDSARASLRTLQLPLASTATDTVSGDGQGVFFRALNRFGISNIDFFDLRGNATVEGPLSTSDLFTTDRSARWIAYQALDPAVPNPTGPQGGTLQYFLYDRMNGSTLQLTHDPNAIVYPDPADRAACPQLSGTTPLISGDGTTVVLITSSTLGLADPDSTAGCRTLVYDIDASKLRYVTRLPSSTALRTPALSNDGRWLSFNSSRVVQAGFRQGFGALLDLHTGALIDPIGGIKDFPTFDAVISGDGSTIVLSTTADLDTRVGNGDHNPELFAYDTSTGGFTQISDTIGGISGGPLCDSFRPAVNGDGRVVVFGFSVLSTGECEVAVPQRNNVDGLDLGRVRALRKRSGNHPPTLAPLTSVRVLAGERLTLQFAATDTDGDAIVFFAQTPGGLDIPPGSMIEDHHNGTATFSWPTKPAQAGSYPLRVAAFDEGGGETLIDLNLAVCSRITNDGNLLSIVDALFESEPPPVCRDADANQDGAITAADLVKVGLPQNVTGN